MKATNVAFWASLAAGEEVEGTFYPQLACKTVCAQQLKSNGSQRTHPIQQLFHHCHRKPKLMRADIGALLTPILFLHRLRYLFFNVNLQIVRADIF